MKLKDIFEKPISGEWGKEVGEGEKGSKVIRTTNFTNIGRLDLSSIVERDIDSIKHENKKLKFGDIIIEKSGGSPTQPVGRVVIFEETNEDVYFCNNFTSILRPNKNIVPKFGLYLLKNLYNKKKVLKFQNKTTGIINIKLNDYLNNTEITIPNLEVQNRIAEVLNKTQELIDKRKEQIESLDELVKSKFIEMFGDPITNSKEWNTFELREGIKEIKYGTSKPPIFSEEGIPFVRATNIKFGRIIENDMKYISEYEAEKIEKCKLSLGDTIIVRSGANTGDNAFVSEEYVGSYGGYDIIVKLNEKINYIFLNALLNSIYRETIIQPLTRRAGQPHLNSEQIQSLVIYNPPIELQNQFADFVKQVDKLKFEMEKSLKELEDNFNSLMQNAFKGELFK
ncbi:restriction endonuclease subunit S [Clostridium perfringens]|nr:restriction endonuclease subunit S [Clostridium perfringens]MDK0410321.1 restriction endonuclease subunit S [Clostridium perfringens]MDK0444497.1 restriction endonuclease subunit S [Clostridium perfringens]MDK0498182.1 restriction endonuclease subunit S [Clostridium perfringens]